MAGLSAFVYSACFGALGCDGGSETGTGGTGGVSAGGSGGTGGVTVGGTGGTGGVSMGGTGGTGGTGATGGTGGTGATGGTGGAGGGGSCAPMCAEVENVPSECIALVDNKGLPKFGLRMAQIAFQKPTALTNPLLSGILDSGATMNLPDCNLNGNGNFSWLMEIDTAGAIKTGGGKPVVSPTDGYCFVAQSLSGTAVAPLESTDLTIDGAGLMNMPTGGDVVIPIFLDAAASSYVLMPLKQLRILNAQLSEDQNCVGHYNADTLSPDNGCKPGGGVTRFTNGGAFDGHVTLEDADAVIVAALNQSLCVLLTGDPGNGQTPKKCSRDANGNLIAKGDWCSETNMAGGCQDALQVTGSFAASGVQINGDCP
ncbi:MAG: hypothetical protein R3F14_36180 [Polyangiaceae bacterium]